MKTKVITSSWYEDFVCPGGDCGLSCCTCDWGINVKNEEMDRFDDLEDDLKAYFLDAIDREKMLLRMCDNRCVLLDENGFCNIVSRVGPEYLFAVCTDFPRIFYNYGDVVEVSVELACPIVAEYLLKNETVSFSFYEVDSDSGSEGNFELYDGLSRARSSLISIYQCEPGKYTYGKLFILIRVLNELQLLGDSGNLNTDTVQTILDKYCSSQAVVQSLTGCEEISQKTDAKIPIIQETLNSFLEYGLFTTIRGNLKDRYYYIMDYVEILLRDSAVLKRDLISYMEFIRKNYPLFTENFLVYSLYDSLMVKKKELLGKMISCRFLEIFTIQIYGMAIWKYEANGSDIDAEFAKKLSVAIAAVDRFVSHAPEFKKRFIEYYEKYQKHDLIDLMLLFIP